MRSKILDYLDETNNFPSLGVVFVGNRAVVSTREIGSQPKFHRDVYFGPFFWWRLEIACRKVFKKQLKR